MCTCMFVFECVFIVDAFVYLSCVYLCACVCVRTYVYYLCMHGCVGVHLTYVYVCMHVYVCGC